MLRYLAILLGATLFLVSPSAPTTAQQTDFDAIYKLYAAALDNLGLVYEAQGR